MRLTPLIRTTAFLAPCSLAAAQSFVLVPDSSADKIVKLDPTTGAIIDANFILDAGGTPFDFQTPKDVFQVGNEIWVLDQVSDSIFRFDQNGAWLGTTDGPTGTLDNIRGGCFANNTVYVSNDGTANGATGDTVVMFNTSGVKIGQFSVANTGTSPFDVTEYNGELLVCHFTAVNTIGRYDYAGNLLGTFHSSGGVTDVDSPEQLGISSTNTVFAAGFASPIGVYEYDSAGALINTYSHTSALRGVLELGNGLLLITDGAGVKTYDRTVSGGAPVLIHATTGGQFFGSFSFGTPPVTYCTAGTSSNNCVPAISATGTPSAAASSGFTISVANVEGQKQGLLFYGISGQAAAPWGIGGTSFLCVKSPTQRMAVQNSGGTANACDGSMSEDWLAYIAAHPTALGAPFSAGAVIDAQGWYRDPPAVKTTNLSDGLEFTLVP